MLLTVVAGLIGVALGVAGLWTWLRTRSASRLRLAEDTRRALVADTEREVETMRREAQIGAREQAVEQRATLESEARESRIGVAQTEARIHRQETELMAKGEELARREQGIDDRETHTRQLQAELKAGKEKLQLELERVGGLTTAAARAQILEQSEDIVRHDLARTVRRLDEDARDDAARRARALVADSIQRVAVSQTTETTVSVVSLASEDMKGRIIGREGRNIRALEQITGVTFIIEERPHSVVLSSFDGLRRELARMTLEKLIEDGRIHPASIEEMYYLSKAELEERVRLAGEQAVFDANCGEFHEELVKVLGRLCYRTSYGQNVLKHSLEVVYIVGIMAAELGAAVKTARRAALLHDIGKAMTQEVEGTHASISAQLARRYGEAEGVVHAIAAHHYEVQPETIEAVLVIAADAISSARTGARSNTIESYIKRLASLEEIAAAKPGVAKAYALRAGREIRVIVEPTEVDDDAASLLSHEIAREIEAQLEYPGQVKVIVIRETRATEIAV
ncbi:MAG: ribonuclease Y [Thermoleophilia bacterium]